MGEFSCVSDLIEFLDSLIIGRYQFISSSDKSYLSFFAFSFIKLNRNSVSCDLISFHEFQNMAQCLVNFLTDYFGVTLTISFNFLISYCCIESVINDCINTKTDT